MTHDPAESARPSIRQRLHTALDSEVLGGVLLMVAALVGLGWANSPWQDSYRHLSETVLGPSRIHLGLSLSTWAGDGLLAVFFFVVGLELKHEVTVGKLSRLQESAVPVLAAVGGMVVPAVFFAVIVVAFDDPAGLRGWAIPTATDIAFALAVLAVFGRGLPAALRLFLLTLAVIDDLLAIIVIATFYTERIDLLALGLALVVVGVFALAVRLPRLHWWLLWPLGVLAWGFMHVSGVHATVAGVLLGLSVPAVAVHGSSQAGTTRLVQLFHPWSSGLALPVFAFFAAGVSLSSGAGARAVLIQPVVLAVLAGLVAGKVIGVLGTTALITRFTALRLPDSIGLRDLLPVGLLTGIGFTVALLVAGLSFEDPDRVSGSKIAVLIASLVSAALAGALLRWDAHKARTADMNEDGQPDQETTLIP